MAEVVVENNLNEEEDAVMAVSPPAPAPPAPPPPLAASGTARATHPAGDVCPASAAKLMAADGSTSPQGKARELETIHSELSRMILIESLDLGNNCILISRNKVLKAILQDGPMCGLVALSMSSQMVKNSMVSSETLFNHAREKGMTLQGEMFSAAVMAEIAEDIIQCKSWVLELDNQDSMRTLIEHLLKGNPVIFPYDADANHQPCLKKGHKAHWAAISGVLIIREASISEDLLPVLEADDGLTGLYHVRSTEESTGEAKAKDGQNPSYNQAMNNIIEAATDKPNLVYLYCKQGKSKYTRLFPLVKFLESNKNLTEIDPKITQNIQDFVVPEEGIQGICGKVVLLEKTSSCSH